MFTSDDITIKIINTATIVRKLNHLGIIGRQENTPDKRSSLVDTFRVAELPFISKMACSRKDEEIVLANLQITDPLKLTNRTLAF